VSSTIVFGENPRIFPSGPGIIPLAQGKYLDFCFLYYSYNRILREAWGRNNHISPTLLMIILYPHAMAFLPPWCGMPATAALKCHPQPTIIHPDGVWLCPLQPPLAAVQLEQLRRTREIEEEEKERGIVRGGRM
jgi:hypothetical protein